MSNTNYQERLRRGSARVGLMLTAREARVLQQKCQHDITSGRIFLAILWGAGEVFAAGIAGVALEHGLISPEVAGIILMGSSTAWTAGIIRNARSYTRELREAGAEFGRTARALEIAGEERDVEELGRGDWPGDFEEN